MIEMSITDSPILQHIDQLASLLETCKFNEFWKLRRDDSVLNIDIPSFDDAMRKFICHVVGATFQSIDFEELRSYLGGVDPNVLKNMLNENGWKLSGSKVLTGLSLAAGTATNTSAA